MRDDATLLFFSCQHARFVEAAAASVLAQQEVRLRIIFSDDASTDGSWELIQRVAAGYAGPHRVELRRNSERLGVITHFNSLMAAVDSDLVILAACDDLSRPDRAARLRDAWRAAGEPRAYLTSDARIIDETDRPGEVLRAHPPARNTPLVDVVRATGGDVLGCTGALHREVWRAFGPFTVSHQVEDRPLAFRATALEGVLHVPEPLVDYRIHQRNLSQDNRLPGYADSLRRRRCDFETQIFGQFLADLDHSLFSRRFHPAEVAAARRAARSGMQRARSGLDYLAARGWHRWMIIGRTLVRGQSPRRLLSWSWETLTRPRSESRPKAT